MVTTGSRGRGAVSAYDHPMRPSARRLVTLLTIGALAVAACGGDEDSTGPGDVAVDAGDSSADGGSSDDDAPADDDEGSTSEAGFGEFTSGSITVTGSEDLTYSVDDPAFDFIGAGGCDTSTFGFTVQVRDSDTGITTMQLATVADADLNGGATGSFPVENLSLVAVTDGDVAASRSYDGPATLVVSEHDTGGATADLNARRMVLTLDGILVGSPSDGGGEVEVAADLEWVMGCP
jgi:hypothetical protein